MNDPLHSGKSWLFLTAPPQLNTNVLTHTHEHTHVCTHTHTHAYTHSELQISFTAYLDIELEHLILLQETL